MRRALMPLALLGFVLALGCCAKAPEVPEAPAGKNSVPMFGGDVHRNMANTVEKDIPASWVVAKDKEEKVKWSAEVGTNAFGGPVVAGGRIFIGTNNDRPRDPAIKGDKGVLMCFNEADGKFLWQIVHDKLPDTHANDYPNQGIASSPVVEGEHLYYVSNRAELVCAKVENGEIVWKLDMIKKLDIYPCQLANCSPLIIDDLVLTITGNGVDPQTHKLPRPKAPSFIAVDKKTGEVKWQNNAPGTAIMEGQWSNPAAAKVKDRWLAFFPGGDGYIYALEAKTGELVWKFNCNPAKAVFKPGGRGDASYFIATPVVYEDKLYIATGTNPEDGPGPGHLWCIDITVEPKGDDKDVSPRDNNFDPAADVNKGSALVWHVGGDIKPLPDDGREWYFSRTLSTVAIHDGLVYATEMMGFVQCLDAKTGKKVWEHDLLDSTWCSPYYVDGKVFQGTDGGWLYVFQAGKEKKLLGKVDMRQSVKTPPVAVNGTLLVCNGYMLYAITNK